MDRPELVSEGLKNPGGCLLGLCNLGGGGYRPTWELVKPKIPGELHVGGHQISIPVRVNRPRRM